MSPARLLALAILCAPFALALTTPAHASCAPVTFGVGGSGDPSSSHLPTRDPYTPVPWDAPNIPSDASQAQGRAALNTAISSARVGCPGRTIRVTGYSAGAKVAGDICDQQPAIRCTLIADPRNPGGIETNYPSPLPGWTMTGPRPPRANETQVCIPHDWVCDAPPLFDPAGAADALVGAFTGRHQQYYR